VRVYISVDMEGIAGVSHPDPTDPSDRRYPVAVDLMVGETTAAIEGALAAGATDILVNDSHWNMYNLLPADLHPAARVLQGQKAWSMVAGAMPGADGAPAFDVALFVGYHTRAGHPTGTIAHTYSGMPVETRLDGRPTGEYGMNALVLGAWGIPVGMVAGDDGLAEEVEPWLPWAERIVVKTMDGGRSAISVHPTVARERVRAGAESAVRRAAAGEMRTLEVGPPVTIEIDVPRGVIADHAAIMPGVERIGDRTVRFVHDDPETAYRGFLAMVRLVEPVSG
jgi:D-amino peptidase